MKVIIAGTRTFTNYELLKQKCDYLLSKQDKKEIQIISGGAAGADKMGKRYARQKGYKLKIFEADWELHGKAAGPIRNKQMAEYADAAIIFWDGKSFGTLSMINNAKLFKLKISIIKYI